MDRLHHCSHAVRTVLAVYRFDQLFSHAFKMRKTARAQLARAELSHKFSDQFRVRPGLSSFSILTSHLLQLATRGQAQISYIYFMHTTECEHHRDVEAM